MVLIYS